MSNPEQIVMSKVVWRIVAALVMAGAGLCLTIAVDGLLTGKIIVETRNHVVAASRAVNPPIYWAWVAVYAIGGAFLMRLGIAVFLSSGSKKAV